jgi:hypothetical protein
MAAGTTADGIDGGNGMTVAHVKNWADFQHYKNRAPPWIKLHRGILDNYEFHCLPVASKALAPCIWLLAAESNDGSVCIAPEFLAFRLRMTEQEAKEALIPLIEKGFLLVASNVLADCKQSACLEREGEREIEGEAASAAPLPKSRKRQEQTFPQWVDSLAGADAIPADDPVFAYADRVGLPRDFVALEWAWFETKYSGPDGKKRYADWRQTFRNAVEGGWGNLWRVNQAGEYYLTTQGVQAQRALA